MTTRKTNSKKNKTAVLAGAVAGSATTATLAGGGIVCGALAGGIAAPVLLPAAAGAAVCYGVTKVWKAIFD